MDKRIKLSREIETVKKEISNLERILTHKRLVCSILQGEFTDAVLNATTPLPYEDTVFDNEDSVYVMTQPDVPVLKQGDIIVVEDKKLVITLDHNNEFSLAPVDQDDLGEAHSEWVHRLAVPTKEQVDEYLDILKDQRRVDPKDTTETVKKWIMSRFDACTDKEAQRFAWNWRWTRLPK